MPRLDAAEEC